MPQLTAPDNLNYQKLKIDELPLIEKVEKLDYHLLLQTISKDSVIQPKVNLANIHCSPYTLGLILTYHVNYGFSARKTVALMYDVHNVRILGQTILNYASSTSVVLKPFRENYPYELSDQFCGGESYIRVGGR